MTAVTLYGTLTAASSLSSASNVSTATGGVQTSQNNEIQSVTGWGEIVCLGAPTTAWAGSGSEMTTPTGKGMLWDVTTLEGQRVAAATLTAKFTGKDSVSADSFTGTVHCRVWKWNVTSGIYTSMGSDIVFSSTTFSGSGFTAITGG